jgi:protein SCO1/2
LRGNKDFKIPFDQTALLKAMDYKEEEVPEAFREQDKIDWSAFFNSISSKRQPEISKEFYSRIEKLPDFRTVKRKQDKSLYFDQDQEVHELAWIMNRGLKLCVQGRGSDNCTQEGYAMMRKKLTKFRGRSNQSDQNLRELRRRSGKEISVQDEVVESKLSSLRRPSGLEKVYYDLALGMKDSSLCGKISLDAVAVGWTPEPGFLFMPVRSVCMTAVAVESKDPEICEQVAPLVRGDLDGADLTTDHCRRIVAGEGRSPHRETLSPDWAESLIALGFTEEDRVNAQGKGSTKKDWSEFASRAMAPMNLLNDRLKDRLAKAPDFSAGGQAIEDDLFYFEEDLQKHLYQLTLIRFHCSIRGSDDGFSKTDKPPAPTVRSSKFALINHDGQAVTDESYRGKFMLVYFGFTGCANICATDLSSMVSALNMLGEPAASKIQPIFITLDPNNDTAEHLAEHVKMFHPRMQGLTGSETQIRQAAREYGAFYFSGEVDGRSVFDHSGFTYLMDEQGRYLDYFEHGDSLEEMVEKLKQYVSKPQNAAIKNTQSSM